MLRVTIELLPGGLTNAKRILHEMVITNIESRTNHHADYRVTHTDQHGNEQTVRVRNHDRRQDAWALVCAAVRELS